MNSGPSLTNCAKILYNYFVKPNEEYITECAFDKNSVQVSPKIKMCYSKCEKNEECKTTGIPQKCYIEAYNFSEYPIEIKIRVFLPSYACYNPYSFIVNGFKICFVNLYDCLNLGVIMPCAASRVQYCACRVESNSNEIKHLSKVEIYYRIGLPGKVCNKWYCITEEASII